MTTYFDINLDLTDEDIAIREEAHKFAREVIRPVGRELDRMTLMSSFAVSVLASRLGICVQSMVVESCPNDDLPILALKCCSAIRDFS